MLGACARPQHNPTQPIFKAVPWLSVVAWSARGFFGAGARTLNAFAPLVPVNDIPIKLETCCHVGANMKHFVKMSAF